MKIYITLMALILLLTGCTSPTSPPLDIEEPDNVEEEVDIIANDPIKDLIRTMTLEEKIGQLLIVGLEGTQIREIDKFNISTNKVGGFILFSRNIDNEEQVINLLNDLNESNKENKLPLFFSIDEEGGKVSRLSRIYTNLPSALTLGNKNDKALSYEYGKIQGLKLSSLGFNMNFAPVMDINSNPNNPVIGDRAYGSNSDIVVEHSIAVMNGLNDISIITAAKHFPGHGDTSIDSHLSLPTIDKSYEELEALELIPFKAAIENDIDTIMVAHILYPQLDENYPSTLSKEIIQGILRENLEYKGVVISDDITMGAITNTYSIGDAVVRFLISGGDIALVCHGDENPTIVINRIKEAIENEEIDTEEIDEKVYRIIELKNRYLIDSQMTIEDKETINTKANNLINRLK